MQRVAIQLEDDLTGGPADETIKFAVDGRDYEIDLNTRHATAFRRQLAPFVQHARLVHAQRARARTRTTASRQRSRDIRAWAEQHGLPVAEHGRLPSNVVHEYELAYREGQSEERRAGRRSAGRKADPRRAVPKPRRAAKPSGPRSRDGR
jgi:hypothetical protein